MKLERFLDDLASAKATPGGGSASALAATLSASLVAMVAGLSTKDEAKRGKEMERIRARALSMQSKLSAAVSEDAASFNAVMASFRLPRDTDEDRLLRSRMIQEAYRQACMVPKRIVESSVILLGLCSTLISRGNPNAKPDATVAVHLANAAFEGGIVNIRVNLLSIQNQAFKSKMQVFINLQSKKRDRLLSEILNKLERT